MDILCDEYDYIAEFNNINNEFINEDEFINEFKNENEKILYFKTVSQNIIKHNNINCNINCNIVNNIKEIINFLQSNKCSYLLIIKIMIEKVKDEMCCYKNYIKLLKYRKKLLINSINEIYYDNKPNLYIKLTVKLEKANLNIYNYNKLISVLQIYYDKLYSVLNSNSNFNSNK
jgi:hypothetical protein